MNTAVIAFLGGVSGFVCGLLTAMVIAYVPALVARVRLSLGLKKGRKIVFRAGKLLDHELRPRGLYVRYQNDSNTPFVEMGFKIRVFENGELEDEFSEHHEEMVLPGEIAEGILDGERLMSALDAAPERTYTVSTHLARKQCAMWTAWGR